ncbi:MAG: FAD-binding protein [Planctomycetes bacterium]|nr:FAD-binding protein [Planctomycetota bacterium]
MTRHPAAVPPRRVHTLIIGSGAAGLAAAVQLHKRGIDDILVVTEGLHQGTSINTGSDKQTYYKLSLCGADADSPQEMAENYFAGGSMHGDLALAEAANSVAAFLHLADLGVAFPRDPSGQFIGYKTDHDPRQRATSVGPYTSRDMCRALIAEVRRRNVAVREKLDVVALPVMEQGGKRRIAGAVAVDAAGRLATFLADNVVFATGGPGGLYATSVYPAGHTGGIGLALLAGVSAQSLPEAQFGMASIKFRWNVSGTYMQAIPRFVSTDARGGDAQEFLAPYFADSGDLFTRAFLKGYQWPFDPRKVPNGSSVIDLLVYVETVLKGRRVWLDFRRDPSGYRFANLGAEAQGYLRNCGCAALPTPLARLQKMNPGAVALYREHHIDLAKEMLEIAVCAQHNNGGLAANHWWESVNTPHFFPIGEVNGSHGVYRPGGSALNAGQVGALRAADYIAHAYPRRDLCLPAARRALRDAVRELTALTQAAATAGKDAPDWRQERRELQARMTRAAGPVRSRATLENALAEARAQWARVQRQGGGRFSSPKGMAESLRNRALCFAHLVYLEATLAQTKGGVGSRGSALTLAVDDPRALQIPQLPGGDWRFAPEDESFREKVLQTTVALPHLRVRNLWAPRRPIPEHDHWFETAWAAFRDGKIYRQGENHSTKRKR